FIYDITGTDIGDRMFEGRVDKTYGSEQNKIHITDAIRQLLTEDNPKVASVKFQQYNQSNEPEPLKFKNYDDDPTKAIKHFFAGNGRHKLNCALEWLKDQVTERDRAI